jgi:hypothetical protein
MACIADFYRSTISLNGNEQDIYDTPDSFVSVTDLQTLDIAVGSSATTTTTPPFKLEVLDIVENQPELKVTVTTYDPQMIPPFVNYLRQTDTMSVPIESDSPDDAPPTLYGFTAAIKHTDHEQHDREGKASAGKDHQKAAVVTVHVLKSLTGAYSIEGDLAWSPNGHRIAAVEKNDLGQRWLILINRKAHVGEGEDRNDERSERSNVDARILLPISGPIKRIDFTSDTHVRVEGETQIYELDIPAYGKVRNTSGSTITPALPKQFSIGDLFLPIYGWVCQ